MRIKSPMFSSILFSILLAMFMIILCSSFSYAWTSYTHKWICDHAGLSDLDCVSADNPAVQSQHPDVSFKYHHCASDAFDCDARLHAAKFLSINTTESRGFAAHLYADSMVPVHWYSTDYDTCHKIFEDAVETKLRNSENVKYHLFNSIFDFSIWNVTMTCPAKFGKEYKNVSLYADNMYMDSTAKYVADQMHAILPVSSVKEYDFTPVVYVLIAFMIIIFTLFVFFGMKNGNDNVKKKR